MGEREQNTCGRRVLRSYTYLRVQHATDVEAANAKAPKHPLMEDGKGGVAVKGLEEVTVANPEEIFDHIRRGSAKRRKQVVSLVFGCSRARGSAERRIQIVFRSTNWTFSKLHRGTLDFGYLFL